MKITPAKPLDTSLTAFVETYFLIEEIGPLTGSTIPNGRLDMSIVLKGEAEWFYSDKQAFEKLPTFAIYPITQTPNLVKTLVETHCISVKLFPHLLTLPFFKNMNFKGPRAFTDFFPNADEEVLMVNLKNCSTIEQMVPALDSFFRTQFYTTSTNLWMQQVTQIIESDSQRVIHVQSLADSLGVSIKTVERKFIQTTGLTPKQFVRIIQLQQVTRKIRNSNQDKGHGAFTELLDSSYYDQSHFIKTCKKITGFTPKQFFAGLAENMTDLVVV